MLSRLHSKFTLPTISRGEWPSACVGTVSLLSNGEIGMFSLLHSEIQMQSPSHPESKDNKAGVLLISIEIRCIFLIGILLHEKFGFSVLLSYSHKWFSGFSVGYWKLE